MRILQDVETSTPLVSLPQMFTEKNLWDINQGLPREDESNPIEFKLDNIQHNARILCKFI